MYAKIGLLMIFHYGQQNACQPHALGLASNLKLTTALESQKNGLLLLHTHIWNTTIKRHCCFMYYVFDVQWNAQTRQNILFHYVQHGCEHAFNCSFDSSF